MCVASVRQAGSFPRAVQYMDYKHFINHDNQCYNFYFFCPINMQIYSDTLEAVAQPETVSVSQRVSTPRGEKVGGRRFFCQIKPNWPLPYSIVPLPRLRDARPAGWVTSFSIWASTMPRAQNRATNASISEKSKRFAHLGMIYLCRIPRVGHPFFSKEQSALCALLRSL